MKKKKHICFDCKKEMFDSGIIVGRISCETVWTGICDECFEKQPMTQKQKKEYLLSDRALKNLAKAFV